MEFEWRLIENDLVNLCDYWVTSMECSDIKGLRDFGWDNWVIWCKIGLLKVGGMLILGGLFELGIELI